LIRKLNVLFDNMWAALRSA